MTTSFTAAVSAAAAGAASAGLAALAAAGLLSSTAAGLSTMGVLLQAAKIKAKARLLNSLVFHVLLFISLSLIRPSQPKILFAT
jgi:hypothetical protein